MNECELNQLLGGARRAVEDAVLPADFACLVQAALPPRVPRLCTRSMALALALILPIAAVAAAWAVSGAKPELAPPSLTLYQGGGLAWPGVR